MASAVAAPFWRSDHKIMSKICSQSLQKSQEVLNPTPLNPTPATCHKRKRKQFSECCAAEVALQHWLFCSADVILTKAALQGAKNCTATSKKLHCKKVALSCRFPAGFKPPRLGTHVSDLLKKTGKARIAKKSWQFIFLCFISWLYIKNLLMPLS